MGCAIGRAKKPPHVRDGPLRPGRARHKLHAIHGHLWKQLLTVAALPPGIKFSFKRGKYVAVFFVQPGSTGNGDVAKSRARIKSWETIASCPAGCKQD
jgi:hypothetical protein